MIRYGFELFFRNSELALKEMQTWMHSPVGIAVTVLGVVTLVGFSFLANHLDKRNNRFLNRFIITLWPYIRDSLKSLRNGLRGVTSTLSLLFLLDIKDLRYLIVPVAIGIGILSMLNRICLRYKTNHQKEILKTNKKLLVEIAKETELSHEQIEAFRNKMRSLSNWSNMLSFSISLFSGLIDGINPYIGTLALGISPPILILITVFCSIYFCAVLTIRIYDEICFQRKLHTSKQKINLALLEKEIALIKKELAELKHNLSNPSNDHLMEDYLYLENYLDKQLLAQAKMQQELLQPKKKFIFLIGVKNGLNIYKYIMLSISLFLFLVPIKIDSLAPVKRAIIGMLALLVGSIQSFSSHFYKSLWQENCSDEFPNDLYSENNHRLMLWKKTNSQLRKANLFFPSPSAKENLPLNTSEMLSAVISSNSECSRATGA